MPHWLGTSGSMLRVKHEESRAGSRPVIRGGRVEVAAVDDALGKHPAVRDGVKHTAPGHHHVANPRRMHRVPYVGQIHLLEMASA